MSEHSEVYQADGRQVIEAYCECGAFLWNEIILNGSIHIEIGGKEFDHVSGRCKCGRRLEWHANQVRLERLLERLLRARGGE